MTEALRQRKTPALFDRKGWRDIDMPGFLKLIESYGADHAELGGMSPGGAAAQLGITRQAVHLAINRGYLDAWRVSGSGAVQMICITNGAMKRYKRSPVRAMMKFRKDQLTIE